MKKNSKLVAVLTILCLLVSMLPVAAFAAPAEGHDAITNAVMSTGEVTVGSETDVTVTLTAATSSEASNFIVELGNEELKADPASQTGTELQYKLAGDKVANLAVGSYALVVKNAKQNNVVQDAAGVANKKLVVKRVETAVDANASKIKTDDDNVDVDVDDEIQVNIDLLNKAGQTPDKFAKSADGKDKVLLVWAEDSVNAPSTALQGAANRGTKVLVNKVGGNPTATAEVNNNGFILVKPEAPALQNSIELKVSVARAGKYNLRAAYLDEKFANDIRERKPKKGKAGETWSVKDINGQDKLGTVSGNNTMVINANENVGKFKVACEGKVGTLLDGEEWGKENKSQKAITVSGNGITETKIDVTLLKGNGDNVGSGMNVTVETSSSNVDTDKTSYTTDYQGKITIKTTGKIDGTYYLYVTANGKTITIPVKVGSTAPVDIKVLKDSADKLAWNSDFEGTDGMKDFVRLQVTDIYGNTVEIQGDEKDGVNYEPIMSYSDEDYTKVIEKPSNMSFTEKDVKLVQPAGKDYYTLQFKKELKKGKYEIRFALENGKSVTIHFEIADFGTAKDLAIEYDVQSAELDSFVAEPTIKLIDENGVVKKDVNGVNLGYNGYAVEKFFTENKSNYDGEKASLVPEVNGKRAVKKGAFIVKNDDKYIGSKITVTGVSQRYGMSAKAEITVAEDGRTMTFNPTGGPVNANNTVNFQLVDGKGNTIALGSDVDVKDAYVVKQTNEDAKVSVSFGNTSDLKDKGQGEIKVNSDRVTKADIQVVVTDQQGKYYGGTLTYNFGAAGENASTFVVMNIGKEKASKNNVEFTMDAAPIIKDNRTFVPYRALIEAFGAEVKWDDKARTVTATLDGREVTLTIDSKELTVNGKKLEKEMDVAPFISNDRTMVPVRFVAEEFGFTVTPIYNSNNGGTAAVYFAR